ncbi:MAG: glycosyltransferase family 2 protein, partial [Ardenticatenaceae bacterium]
LWRRRGVLIEHVRRPDRRDYKAGALRYGLERATGEFVALFDADFVPPPDWLRRAVALFCRPGMERLGLVQTRWSHLNAGYSPLTRAQALALDGHFAVEQAARASSGLFFNFNGTAGLWRRTCIEEAGGWSGSTLSEDLDLSYRAQLAGWRLLYDGSIIAPAEIPAQIASFKRQQFRWAKGSMQVMRRLSGSVLRARLSLLLKVEALLHLTAYVVHPLIVLLLLLTLPLLWWGWPASFTTHQELLTWTSVVGLGAPILYAVAQYTLYGVEGGRRYRWMPLLVLLGSGVALSNTRAVLEGLFGAAGGEFKRTPKFRLKERAGVWQGSRYALGADWATAGELFLAAYALLSCLVAIQQAQWFALPFLILYVLAFGWVAILGLWQARASRPEGIVNSLEAGTRFTQGVPDCE